MIVEAPHDKTLAMSHDDERTFAIVFHRVRSIACRVVADCQRMLEAVDAADRTARRKCVGDALVASHQLLAATAALRLDTRSTVASRTTQLTEVVRDPRQRIIESMSALLRLVPVSTADELLLRDAQAVREAVMSLASAEGRTASPANGTAEAATNGKGRARLLVVDDEKMLRDILIRRLAELQNDVLDAANGIEALDIVAREHVDVVITDINMPELDGIELLRILKSTERTQHIPVIVVSSQGDLASVTTCIELGAEDLISKPYQPQLLNARVRAALDRKRMRDAEVDYLRRVRNVSAAAEAVEEGTYDPGSLVKAEQGDDELARLARVFDRMVSALRTREDRLQNRLHRLRHELGDTTGPSRAATVSDQSPFGSGEVLAGRYEILGHLGNGGMGMVYHARDQELGEEVAIKVVRKDLVRSDPTIIDRLKSEIRLARKISHRNVVRAHDLGEFGGVYFLTMEYVKGITVAELLDRRGRLPLAATLAIATQLCDALATAHDLQIVHRDIKPANLLIDESGVLKVMDFGIARSFDLSKTGLTTGGFIIGTPQYMSPEQLTSGTIDGRSDLFAVGVVLYECLTGRPPFKGETPIALFAEIVDGHCAPLAVLASEVPPDLARLVHQQFRVQPAERSGSARELAGRLAEFEHAS